MGRRRTVYLPTCWSHKKSTIHVSVKQTKKVPGDPWGRSLAWFHWSALLYGLRGRLSLDNRYPLKKMFTEDWNRQNHPKKNPENHLSNPSKTPWLWVQNVNFAGVESNHLLLQLFWSYRMSPNHPHSTLPWPLWPSLHSWPAPPLGPDKEATWKLQRVWQYCWSKKSCTSWYAKYPIIYRVLYIPSGARFLPSTVCSATKTKRQSSWENDKGSKEDALLPGSSDFQLWRSASSYMNFGICNILS